MENPNKDIPTPLIDLARLSSLDCEENEFQRIGKEIVKCFQNHGFVYLTNIGIAMEETKEFVKAFDTFNELDTETKMKYYRNTETFHGFSTDATEIANFETPLSKRSSRSMFDIKNLCEPFPEEVPELKAAATPLTEKLVPITLNILKAIELGLELPVGFLVDKHQSILRRGNFSNLRVVRYCPPTSVEQTIKFEPHCDFATVSLQLLGDLEGLQLLDRHENWQTAKLYEGYSLLFPSEQLQMMTSNKIKALKHQVVNPSDIRDIGKPRHAVLFFAHPDCDADIRSYNHSHDSPLITSREFVFKRAKAYFTNGPFPDINKLEILEKEKVAV